MLEAVNALQGDVRLRFFLVAVVVFGALFGAFFYTRLGANLWLLLTDGGPGGYFIPRESNVFTFRATEVNNGSGGWWLRGEDAHHVYALVEGEAAYIVFPKDAAARCRGFVEADPDSWCLEDRELSQSK